MRQGQTGVTACVCVCLCNGVKWACLGKEICLPDTRRPRKDRGNCPIAGSPTITAVKSVTTRGIHKLCGLYRSCMTERYLICSLYNLQCCKMPNVEGNLLIRRKFRVTVLENYRILTHTTTQLPHKKALILQGISRVKHLLHVAAFEVAACQRVDSSVFNRTLNFKANSGNSHVFSAILAKAKGQKFAVCRLILLLMSHGLSMDGLGHR